MSEADHPEGGASALEPVYEADSYEYADARELMRSLDLAEPVAIALARRGHRSPEQARAFLEGEERHEPSEFTGIGDAVAAIEAAIGSGKRITVHGDYDVDGISATAILVAGLRRAGADCDWLIPDRASDGYGISAATVERLIERGTGLLITADCGIASAAEIATAMAAGIDAVVTDHHAPGQVLPECPVVHPGVCGYPFEGLCGAAVAYKLVAALEKDERGLARELDLVALATIADLVPLIDENRTLARLGIAELRRARRPGIRALLAAASVEPEHLDEGDIAFRIAPRLNAAGRLYRADAGVELMLTDDAARAAEIAAELDSANRERRELEREVSAAASAAHRELSEEAREAPGIVLAGEGWHPGVVGIAASRTVDRLGRPSILLAITPDGRARGSGRGIPGFDLLAALEACSEHLDRFGGHRAAAGLELEASRIDAFRAAFAAAAAEQLPEGPPKRPERIDAVVGPEALDLRVAEQLAGLGPFGQGNPEIRLLVPWAIVGDVRPMGREGRHARFVLGSGGARASGVAFNANGALSAAQATPHDLTVRLEVNHWNGAVEPRAVLDGTRGGETAAAGAGCGCPIHADPAWWERFEAALAGEPGALEIAELEPRPRERIAHERRSAVALIGELLSSGQRVLVVGADARRRAELASLAASPSRFGGRHAIVCGECPEGALREASASAEGAALVLCDWAALGAQPEAAFAFTHLLAVDAPPLPALAKLAGGSGPGYLHEAWSGAGELAELSWTERLQPRTAMAEIYRGALDAPASGEALGELLVGSGSYRRSAAVAADCVRVLGELGIARLDGQAGARELVVLCSERTELERSRAWRALAAQHEEGLQYLQSRTAS